MIMHKNNESSLLPRREFFKKATKAVLPIVAAISMPSLLLSCGGSEDDNLGGDDSGNDDSGNNNGSGGTTIGISKADGVVSGYAYVDLGLSVKWAICNLGANKAEGYGSYKEIVSGITGSKADDVSWELYKVYKNNANKLSIAGSSFDPVSSAYGNSWFLPTKAHFEELIANCTKEFIIYNKVKGIKFVSKKNGHSLFLPFAGFSMDIVGWEKYNVEELAEYWSSDVYTISKYREQVDFYGLFLDNETVKIIHDLDSYTIRTSIRPVTSKSGSSVTNCNGTCTANCSSSSTNSSCSNCSSSCSSGCKTNCDYNCAATCKSHCYGQCSDTCGGGCKAASKGSSCSGCARTCNNRCYQTCSYACSANCESSCVKGTR